MSDLIKKIKIKKEDGTYTNYIPIGAEAKNIDMKNNYSVQANIGDIDVDNDGSISEQLKNKVNIDNIYNKDKYYKNMIGVFQNEQEQKYTTYGQYIDFGEPDEPPMLDSIPYKGVDIIAHFYNDFGLKSTAMSPNQAHGSWKWYDWSWNFSDTANYDPARVPLLGYYQGDDRKTLDWILYWLGKAGVNVISLVDTSGINMENWESEASTRYWEYVLLNECKNINNFKVLPWLGSSYNYTVEKYEALADNFIQFVKQYSNKVYSYTYNNKSYVAMYTWEFEGIRGAYDNYQGATNTLAYFKSIAARIKEETNFDGLCLIGRHYYQTWADKYAESDGLIAFHGDYSDGLGAQNYEEYANTDYIIEQGTWREYQVLNVMTSAESHPYHPSTFHLTGSTPKLFSKALNKAIQTIAQHNTLPKMLTIYNVSEWAEGGPGLIPNIQDGFGYLDAIGGSQYINFNNINTNKIIKDTKDFILSQSHDFIAIKKQIINLPTGKTISEFGAIAHYFNYTYKATDYVFQATLESTSTNLANITVTAHPAFGSGRIYVDIYNSSGTALQNLSDVYVNLIILKRNAYGS